MSNVSQVREKIKSSFFYYSSIASTAWSTMNLSNQLIFWCVFVYVFIKCLFNLLCFLIWFFAIILCLLLLLLLLLSLRLFRMNEFFVLWHYNRFLPHLPMIMQNLQLCFMATSDALFTVSAKLVWRQLKVKVLVFVPQKRRISFW